MPAFQFANDKRWRKLGLEGDLLWALIHDGALQLQDDVKHVVRIEPNDIVRMRIGYFDAKRRMYHTRIWLDNVGKPLELTPTTQTWHAYRDTVYALSQLMTDASRTDRVETGASKFDALFGPFLMAIPTLGAILISLFLLAEEPWWGRMIVPVIPLLILAALLWIGFKRYWPKPVHSIGDLDKQVPPG